MLYIKLQDQKKTTDLSHERESRYLFAFYMIKSTGAESFWRLLPFHICRLSSTVSAGEAALIIQFMTTAKGKGL